MTSPLRAELDELLNLSANTNNEVLLRSLLVRYDAALGAQNSMTKRLRNCATNEQLAQQLPRWPTNTESTTAPLAALQGEFGDEHARPKYVSA